jgi:polar amino acid transport system substrate-binding protein
MRRLFLMGLVVLGLLGSGETMAGQVVRVGGYEFPPFVDSDGGMPKGLSLDLIAALNKAQSRYEFRFVPVAARRRYADLGEGRFDVMLFESPEWEWAEKGLPVDFTSVFLRGGELFITQARPGRGQDYFADLKGKRLVGILGYHYGFAGFNADPDYLAGVWGMKLVNTHKSSIDMILADRADLAVVTDSYLWAYLVRNPAARQRLLVSDSYDQAYSHRALVRRNGPIDLATMNGLLQKLEQDDTLAALWRRAGTVR